MVEPFHQLLASYICKSTAKSLLTCLCLAVVEELAAAAPVHLCSDGGPGGEYHQGGNGWAPIMVRNYVSFLTIVQIVCLAVRASIVCWGIHDDVLQSTIRHCACCSKHYKVFVKHRIRLRSCIEAEHIEVQSLEMQLGLWCCSLCSAAAAAAAHCHPCRALVSYKFIAVFDCCSANLLMLQVWLAVPCKRACMHAAARAYA
jgi:hypothetical protein